MDSNLEETFITVKTFDYPTEVTIPKSLLESGGITCFVKDELTVQMYQLYSNAIGGIKLQVRKSDFLEAVEILKESGYHIDEIAEPMPLYNALEKATTKIPLLNKMRFEFRLLLLIVSLVMVAFAIAAIN